MLRPSLRAAGCYACKSLVIRGFIGRPNGAFDAAIVTQHSVPAPRAPQTFRPFSSSNQPDQTPDSEASPEQTTPQGDDAANWNDNAASLEANGSDVPWYLEIEPPRHPTLIHQQAPLPSVPEDSPRLIEPLLKFVSDDLGMDELNLLDLRALDPPPALGPQLLMLFGTARSERHLHVSADRLVRWLRDYGIAAKADGLLGRNELKIKLRRKARRAKLLGNTGFTPNEDDGISTRWICVNLGTIGWSSEESEILGEDGRFSGFGTPQVGTTIVVQMFTDAKRRELDLETLWTRILKRNEDRYAVEDDLEYVEHTTDPAMAGLELPFSQLGSASKHMSTPSQCRFFSTSVRRHAEADDIAVKVIQPLLAPSQAADLSDLSRSHAYDGDLKMRLPERLKTYFTGLPRYEAAQAIRENPDSAFIRTCSLAMQNLAPSQTWNFRLWLHSTAALSGHEDYDLAGIRELLQEMKLSGVEATRDQYLLLLRAIYTRRDTTVRDASEIAMELLETMNERGESVLANDVIVTVIETLAKSGASDAEVG